VGKGDLLKKMIRPIGESGPAPLNPPQHWTSLYNLV